MTTRPLNGLALIPLDQVKPSPNNPRERLTDIDELALSMRECGLIQPIVVQRLKGETYQIIAGHRRHAAAQRLKWTDIPAIIRRDMLPDEELLAMLVENGQRAGLDPIEEARALKRLVAQGMPQYEVAAKIGRSGAHVSLRLGLLRLSIEEQEQVRAGHLKVTHAAEKAKVDAGTTRKRSKATDRAWHFSHTHPLATNAAARCNRLGHKTGRRVSGGIACGECWESVIRADERGHIHDAAAKGICPICDSVTVRSA